MASAVYGNRRQKTTGEIYEQYNRLSRRLYSQHQELARRAHPETGGNSLLVHNWGNEASKAAWEALTPRSRRLEQAFQRLYDAAEHRRHFRYGPRAFRPLWCALCEAERKGGRA
jgi:hypothetical protein